MNIGEQTSISLHCRINYPRKITIGNNTAINQYCFLDGRGTLIIGNNVNIGCNVHIYSAEHDYNSPLFVGRYEKVKIEDHVWIASDVIIMPGVIIKKGSVVAAGSVVTHNVEPYTVVGGIPAKLISHRKKNIQYKTKYFQPFH